MRRSYRPVRLRAAAAAGLLGLGACVIFRQVQVKPVERAAGTIQSPVKAHLLDGSTVVYRQGVTLDRDTLHGAGQRFALGDPAAAPAAVRAVPLDSVAAMESFTDRVNVAPTVAVSTLATAGATVATVVLLKAIFGSCPTVYSDSAGTARLEAESFSYSIAPLFERRDVDRLHARADARGAVRLEVRNEALETHYINHLSLLEARHRADETVVPDGGYQLVAVAALLPLARAADRAGRDLRGALAGDDSLVFRTAPATLAAADAGDLDDLLDLVLPAPRGADSVAVVLNLRNSLLNTVLLYDLMLADPGIRAIDWLGEDMANIGRAVELGRWYSRHMGMRVLVWRGGRFEQVASIPDSGPIAWRRVAAVVPVPPGDTLRVRLSFVADQWRINSAAVAARVRRLEPRVVPLAAVTYPDGTADTVARRDMGDADTRYVQTNPGQRFTARFDAGAAPGRDSTRTFLLGAQGYYTLGVALGRWRSAQDSLERRFAATRVPVQ